MATFSEHLERTKSIYSETMFSKLVSDAINSKKPEHKNWLTKSHLNYSFIVVHQMALVSTYVLQKTFVVCKTFFFQFGEIKVYIKIPL